MVYEDEVGLLLLFIEAVEFRSHQPNDVRLGNVS